MNKASTCLMLLCFISNRPELLQRNILSYVNDSKDLVKRPAFLVVNDGPSFKKNKSFLEQIEKEHRIPIYHISEITAKHYFKQLGYEKFFVGRYGGNRNIGLVFSSCLKENVVFLDDDTRPMENCLNKFNLLFESNSPIVQGQYVGNVGSTTEIIFGLIKTAEEYDKNNVPFYKVKEKLKKLFCGLSDHSLEKPTKKYFLGGALGISFNVSKNYCFFPTDFRIEDSLFCRLLSHFLPKADYFSNSYSEKTPMVIHERECTSPKTFNKNLRNELEGTQVAFFIQNYLERSAEIAVDAIYRKSIGAIRQFYPIESVLESVAYRNLQSSLSNSVDAEIKEELEELVKLCKNPPVLEKDFLVSESNRFMYAQKNWAEICKNLSNSDLIKNLTVKK